MHKSHNVRDSGHPNLRTVGRKCFCVTWHGFRPNRTFRLKILIQFRAQLCYEQYLDFQPSCEYSMKCRTKMVFCDMFQTFRLKILIQFRAQLFYKLYQDFQPSCHHIFIVGRKCLCVTRWCHQTFHFIYSLISNMNCL